VDKYPKDQGIYSLMNNEWIQKPVHGNYNFSKDKLLKQKVRDYMHLIDNMVKSKMSIDQLNLIKKKLRDGRGAAIQKGGEFSVENLVFKELRNRGYLDKLNEYEKSIQDDELSLK
jgi:hypothetical protein